jgi:hypothetical protein
MAQSKVKHKKQQKRLQARQEGWSKISSPNSAKSGRPIFTKPGSNKK